MNTQTQSHEVPFDLALFVAWCAGAIAQGVGYAAYDSAFANMSDALFPPPASGNLRDDADLRRRLARCMARAIWKQTPHPAHRYAEAPLPMPERNAPCHCGSGRKYKQCCQLIERDIPIERMNLLPALLDALPRKRWGELPGSRIDLDMVAHAAQEWTQQGRDKDALTLLEPWFSDDTHFDARHELLFDLLLDAYPNLGKPRKKSALLERALAHGDRSLRSASMQRRVTMLADDGDYTRAWALFAQAQRSEPDSPSLSHLEVTLLLSQGRESEARERARFWLLRFERRRDPGLANLIGLLRSVVNEGGNALLRVAAERDPAIAEFLDLWQNAPPIASHYTLQADGDSAGELRPKRGLKAALALWEGAFPGIAYSPLQDDANGDIWALAPVWLTVLDAHPQLWNAFAVIDGLVRAAIALPIGGHGSIVDDLFDRGERVLREVIRANGANGLKLEWGWLENRPALSLLGGRIARDLEHAPTAENLERLEWLVRTLNPNDNQGFRTALLRRYLELGRHADALAFADRHPDDFAAMRYSRALALFALGRRGEATTALSDAVATYPKLLAWLLKPNPKAPRLSPLGIRVGGDDEAWIYRREHLDLWQRLGTLDWARALAATRRR
jgi:tetratricopeptide (TPR) repeat protein